MDKNTLARPFIKYVVYNVIFVSNVRVPLLLPLLRRKLKSVISEGNCKLRIFLVLKIIFVVFFICF